MPQIMISLVGDVCCRNHGLEGGRAWRNPLGGRASEKGAHGLSQVTGAVPSAERRRSCCGRLRTRWSHTWWPKNKHPNALSSSKLLPELVGFLLFLLTLRCSRMQRTQGWREADLPRDLRTLLKSLLSQGRSPLVRRSGLGTNLTRGSRRKEVILRLWMN